MKYILFMDVQKSNIKTHAAQTVAKRIIDCAYQLKERKDVYSFATRIDPVLESDEADGELFSCLGSLVNTRVNRLRMLSTFPAITRKMSEEGMSPEEIFVCGYETDGIVMFAALLLKAIHPNAKVSIIRELSYASSHQEGLAALGVADRLCVSTVAVKDALGIRYSVPNEV